MQSIKFWYFDFLKDWLTFHMVAEILEDEVEHEEDFQTLLEDSKKKAGE